jgi:hypothetical protein
LEGPHLEKILQIYLISYKCLSTPAGQTTVIEWAM